MAEIGGSRSNPGEGAARSPDQAIDTDESRLKVAKTTGSWNHGRPRSSPNRSRADPGEALRRSVDLIVGSLKKEPSGKNIMSPRVARPGSRPSGRTTMFLYSVGTVQDSE